MMAILLSPAVFLSILACLFIISLFVAFKVSREASKNNELEKDSQRLKLEVDNLKKELALKEELFHGLKSQYDELEKDVERLGIQPPQDVKETQPKQEDPAPGNKPSIVDLLRSLNKPDTT